MDRQKSSKALFLTILLSLTWIISFFLLVSLVITEYFSYVVVSVFSAVLLVTFLLIKKVAKHRRLIVDGMKKSINVYLIVLLLYFSCNFGVSTFCSLSSTKKTPEFPCVSISECLPGMDPDSYSVINSSEKERRNVELLKKEYYSTQSLHIKSKSDEEISSYMIITHYSSFVIPAHSRLYWNRLLTKDKSVVTVEILDYAFEKAVILTPDEGMQQLLIMNNNSIIQTEMSKDLDLHKVIEYYKTQTNSL
ncbi:MAG: hypothetical protein ACI4I3_05400 [Acutalibacteraceae bacterium]